MCRGRGIYVKNFCVIFPRIRRRKPLFRPDPTLSRQNISQISTAKIGFRENFAARCQKKENLNLQLSMHDYCLLFPRLRAGRIVTAYTEKTKNPRAFMRISICISRTDSLLYSIVTTGPFARSIRGRRASVNRDGAERPDREKN